MSYTDILRAKAKEAYYDNILPFYHYQFEPFYAKYVKSYVDSAKARVPYVENILTFMSSYTPQLPSHPLTRIFQLEEKIAAINKEGFADYSKQMITARVDQCAAKENVSSSEAEMIVSCVFKLNAQSTTESFASCIKMTPFNFFQKIEVADALFTCAVDNVRHKIEIAKESVSEAVKLNKDLYGLFTRAIEHVRDHRLLEEIVSKGASFRACSDDLQVDTGDVIKLVNCIKSLSQGASSDLNYFVQCAGHPTGQGLLSLLNSSESFLFCLEDKVYPKQEKVAPVSDNDPTQCAQGEENGECKFSGDQVEVNS